MINREILSEFQKTIQEEESIFLNGGFYILINLANFIYFLNSCSIKLQNEKINRLSYYFSYLFNKINIDKLNIHLQLQQEDIFLKILKKLHFMNIEKNSIKKAVITLFMLIYTHEEVLRFYSKKTFFNENIEAKINKIGDELIQELQKIFGVTKHKNNYLIDCYIILKGLVSNPHYKYILERQSNKKYKNYFNEFQNLHNFVFMKDILQLSNNYSEFLSKGIEEKDYRYKFFQEIQDILSKII